MLTIDPLFLLLKMAIAASIVVAVSIIAEKSKPFIAAMVATLPVSAGPALAFIALDHDDAFLRETLTGALIQNITTGFYCLAFAAIAQRAGTLASLGTALAVWALAGLALKAIGPGLWGGLALSILIYPLLIRAARPYLAATMPPIPPRPWYAIPMRATGVALLVATVTTLSFVIGPYGSGLLAVLPIVLSSLVIILQPRIGGPAMARIIVSGLPGLFGFAFALALAALLAEPLGRFMALGIGLAVTFAWNGSLVIWQRVRA